MAQSSRSGSAAVKGAPIEKGWRRHLEGWQPGLVAVFLAGSAAVLAVPRSVDPAEVPAPLPDARALAGAAERDAARAEAAARLGLDTDVRALGSAIRAYGRVDAGPERTEPAVLAARKQVVDALGPALGQGEEAVLRLRAFQQRAFVREVRRWEATGEEGDDLRELGGDFVGLLRRSGWLAPGGRRLAMDGAALVVLFKKRWNAITGLQGAAFAPSLDEERALYRFLLGRPPRDAAPPAPVGLAATQALRAEEQYRLKKIDEIAALDGAYPRDLARGVVLFRLGRYPAAVEAFRRHLDAAPDGAHTLRARNYLRAALERAAEE